MTAVRIPAADEPCFKNNYDYRLGNSDTGDVMIDLTDAAGNMLTVGVATPGITTGAVAVGDVLDVDFTSDQEEWGGTVGHLIIERAGELVVAVGANEAVGLSVSEGPSECYQEGDLCGREDFAMTVAVAGHAAVDIANGASAEIGDLTVTAGDPILALTCALRGSRPPSPKPRL